MNARSILGVIAREQTYRNLLYLLLAFPLGTAYFVFLVTGLTLGVTLPSILGVGVFLFMLVAWWLLAVFDRYVTVELLRIELPALGAQPTAVGNWWERAKARLTSVMTWKMLVLLFAKFPYGVAAFVVVVTGAWTSAMLLAMPFIYTQLDTSLGSFEVDTVAEAVIASLLGAVLVFVTLHVANAITAVWTLFARYMLGATSR
jgi:hypothetical protein